MEKASKFCAGIECPGLNAGPQSLEHERRFAGAVGTGLAAKNSADKVGEDDIKRNPAK